VNGETVDFTIDSGSDRAISSVTFENVSSLEVMFGNPNNSGQFDNDKNWGAGNGVLLRGEYEEAEVVDVPEPGLVLGLLAASLGGVVARKRARLEATGNNCILSTYFITDLAPQSLLGEPLGVFYCQQRSLPTARLAAQRRSVSPQARSCQ